MSSKHTPAQVAPEIRPETNQVSTSPAESSCRKLLRIKKVEELTSFHRQTIWRKCKNNTFLKPRKLGTLNVWPEDEIQAWLDGVCQSATHTEQQEAAA